MTKRSGNGNGAALVDHLAKIAEATGGDQNWRTLVASLKTPGRTFVQRQETLLKVAKGMREAGLIDRAAAHFMISHSIDAIVDHRISVERSSPELNRILSADGDEESDAEFDRIMDEITATTFEEYGEPDMAKMFRHERATFDELCEAGRLKFFGPLPKRGD